MKVQIEESWRRQLQEEFDKPYFEHLVGFVKEEYARSLREVGFFMLTILVLLKR